MGTTLEQLSDANHSCMIYQNADQQVTVTAEFLKIGLARNEQCVFLEMPEKLAQVRALLQEFGVDTADAERRKALVLSAKRDFLFQGRFDSRRMLAFLSTAIADSSAMGFTALRATGDMNWELGAAQDFQLLIDYEAQLDAFARTQRLVGLCQYQRYTVSSLAICNALETHQGVVMGRNFCEDNLYYQPPDVKLETDTARREQRKGEWMCQQLSRLMPQALIK